MHKCFQIIYKIQNVYWFSLSVTNSDSDLFNFLYNIHLCSICSFFFLLILSHRPFTKSILWTARGCHRLSVSRNPYYVQQYHADDSRHDSRAVFTYIFRFKVCIWRVRQHAFLLLIRMWCGVCICILVCMRLLCAPDVCTMRKLCSGGTFDIGCSKFDCTNEGCGTWCGLHFVLMDAAYGRENSLCCHRAGRNEQNERRCSCAQTAVATIWRTIHCERRVRKGANECVLCVCVGEREQTETGWMWTQRQSVSTHMRPFRTNSLCSNRYFLPVSSAAERDKLNQN